MAHGTGTKVMTPMMPKCSGRLLTFDLESGQLMKFDDVDRRVINDKDNNACCDVVKMRILRKYVSTKVVTSSMSN